MNECPNKYINEHKNERMNGINADLPLRTKQSENFISFVYIGRYLR